MRRSVEGQVNLTVRQVSQFEAVLGSKRRSGYQFNAWEAIYGPVGADGYPRPLWDARTGKIDHEVALYMRDNGYDLRYYAEKKRGAFDQVIFVGTPHGGSMMTGVKFLLDAEEFVGTAFKLGLPEGIAETVAEGQGAMGHDLMPDSLFLRHLGHDPELARRYRVICGRVFGPAKGVALRAAFKAGTELLDRQVAKVDSASVRRQAPRCSCLVFHGGHLGRIRPC